MTDRVSISDDLAAPVLPGAVCWMLRGEGAVALILACYGYHLLGASWSLFALLFLLPDIGIAGYLLGPRRGAVIYNVLHTYLTVAAVTTVAFFAGSDWALPVAAIWFAHIGFDRALGYGLKYPIGFKATHLSGG